jgi:hypothetical protein
MLDLACTFWQIVRGILIVEFVIDMKEVEGNERWESKDELDLQLKEKVQDSQHDDQVGREYCTVREDCRPATVLRLALGQNEINTTNKYMRSEQLRNM